MVKEEMLRILMKLKLDLLMRMKIKNRKRRRKKLSLKTKKMLILGKPMIPNTIRTWRTLTLAKYKNTDMGIEVTLTDESSVMSHSRIQLFSFSYTAYLRCAIIMYNNIYKISTSNLFILHIQVERSRTH